MSARIVSSRRSQAASLRSPLSDTISCGHSAQASLSTPSISPKPSALGTSSLRCAAASAWIQSTGTARPRSTIDALKEEAACAEVLAKALIGRAARAQEGCACGVGGRYTLKGRPLWMACCQHDSQFG
ncbi:hypothetical protein OH76DRAFT_1402891 [Lentinus brumalis]|uniref:Uncharacterized protein n=1 Tax=Lentinus brumalis TaxID=2498619 RepID=A0A371DBW6_9APHY|nr:hypothetical protein OH76DRAFT_1402891 [Polyporus brumalis]